VRDPNLSDISQVDLPGHPTDFGFSPTAKIPNAEPLGAWSTVPSDRIVPRKSKLPQRYTIKKLKPSSSHLMGSITIRLHDGERPPQEITVSLTDPVQILQNHIPAGGRRLIAFQGSLIMAGFSFQYHQIKDGDDLYVVRPTAGSASSPHRSNHRSSLERRAEAAARRAESLTREAARLSDLQCHSMVIWSLAIENDDFESAAAPPKWKTVFDPEKQPDGPNTEPLPVCWNRWVRQ
jgi:hypothetical protein